MKSKPRFGFPGSRKPRRAPLIAVVVVGLTPGLVGPVQAAVTPTSTALTIAQAIASSSVTVRSACAARARM